MCRWAEHLRVQGRIPQGDAQLQVRLQQRLRAQDGAQLPLGRGDRLGGTPVHLPQHGTNRQGHGLRP